MADDLSEYIILEIRVSLYPGILGRGGGRGGEERPVKCQGWKERELE